MHVGRRQLKSESDLAALYRRRESVVSLIRALERCRERARRLRTELSEKWPYDCNSG